MKANQVRSLVSRGATFATPVAALVLGFCVQACGGAGPDGDPGNPGQPTTAQEKTGQTEQDLSLFGVTVPEPTVTFGLGDQTTTIDPVGVIDSLVPDAGITIPDPLAPVETIVTDLGKPISASVGVGDVGVSVTAPSLLPPELGSLLTSLDPFAGGIPVVGK